MIITEDFMTRSDGVKLVRTYSSDGFYIERNGFKYEDAIDPFGISRVYTETDEKIPKKESIEQDYLEDNSDKDDEGYDYFEDDDEYDYFEDDDDEDEDEEYDYYEDD